MDPAALPEVTLEDAERERLATFFRVYVASIEQLNAEGQKLAELKRRHAVLREAIDHAEGEIGFEPVAARRTPRTYQPPRTYGGIRFKKLGPNDK